MLLTEGNVIIVEHPVKWYYSFLFNASLTELSNVTHYQKG
jgi:hypothetical protein